MFCEDQKLPPHGRGLGPKREQDEKKKAGAEREAGGGEEEAGGGAQEAQADEEGGDPLEGRAAAGGDRQLRDQVRGCCGGLRSGGARREDEGGFDPGTPDVANSSSLFQVLFDEEFYSKEEAVKPTFSDLDLDLQEDHEDWDDFECGGGEIPDCEKEDFNVSVAGFVGIIRKHFSTRFAFQMDCDFEPRERKKVKNVADKKSKKKSAFYEAVAKTKPVFDPGLFPSSARRDSNPEPRPLTRFLPQTRRLSTNSSTNITRWTTRI